MKKYMILLLLMFSLILTAETEIENQILSENLNKILTLKIMNVVPNNIWEYFGVDEDSGFYFEGDKNLYECWDSEIKNETCRKITINEYFPDIIKYTSTINGVAYIYNENETITKDNSYIIAKNYVIDENYTYDESNNLYYNNDCVIDEDEDKCIVSVNNILENMTPIYDDWKNTNTNRVNLSTNYELIKKNLGKTLGITVKDESGIGGSKVVPAFMYDISRIGFTLKILNNLNIRIAKYDDEFLNDDYLSHNMIFYNKNTQMLTDLSCELYKITGENPYNNDFNKDFCDLENTFPDIDILRVEERVFYEKQENVENTNLYFNKDTENVEKDILKIVTGEIIDEKYHELTKEWSDDPIVNLYILTKAIKNDDTNFGFIFLAKEYKNLWALSSEIVNKTFQFYENKAKAKGKIKQFMELKSIGLLSDSDWNSLEFSSLKSDIKSGVKVDDVLSFDEGYNNNILNSLGTETSKEVFETGGRNSIFLAYLLDKLNLRLIRDKIYHDYDAEFVKSLFQITTNTEFTNYKTYLTNEYNETINHLSENTKILLMNLFKMQTIAKTIDAINTNGYENTIPEFITWLESRENEISSRFYNIDDINELSSILDNILNEKKEEYNTKIKEDLNTKYLKLNYDIYTLISNDDTSIDYNALVKLYSKLENIEIITNKKKDYSDLKDIIETISNLRYLNILDLEYLAIHKKDLFYSNENTNLYYAYNIYEEKEYTEINLTELIDKNIMLSKPEDITSYSNIGYYIASGLISAHHTKYELLASFIRNISFSINNGINYSDWVKAANEEGMEGNDIWEILGIDKNASLDKTALKNINVSDILQNYSKLSSAVKNRLGLTVNILDDGYDTASMLFDPITALLLSKEFVEKGYYIDKNANGDNAIFNSDRIEVNLSFEVDKLIQDIQNKHNSYLGTFSHLFDNHSLNDFLSGINPENMTNIKEILDFINFSYSINPKTGKREVSINFNLGITDINDRILWNNISGGIGNYTSGDPYGIEHIQNFSDITFTDFLELTYHTGANYLNSLSGGVFTYPDVRVRNHFIDAQLNNYFMRKNEAKALKLYAPSAKEFSNMFKNTFDQIKADYKKLEGGDLDDKEIYDIMLGDAKASLLKTQLGLGGLIDLRADSNKKITELNDQINYLNGLITTIKEALSESLKAQKKAQENYNNDSSPENEEKLVKANSAVDGIKESLAVANKEKVDNEKKLKDEQKENDEIAKKQIKARKEVKIQEAIINETKEKIGVPVVNPMCKPDMYSNNECDNGTGPGGDPRILLSRKGGLGVKLIELANQRILNIPFRECNVITRTCSGNNVEVTSEELQLMFKSIADKAGADDGACDWTPINGCSYFDKTGQGKWYYIDLLWDPRPDFDAIVASLPEEISLEQQLELNLDFLLDLEIDLRTNLNERLNIDLEIPEMP